jgi:cytochrome c oxidase subunit 4
MTSHVPIPTVKILVAVWAALILMTITTVSVSYLELGEGNIVLALTIALVKASLVAWVFMGIRHSTTLTKLFCVAGLVWLGILILITFSDYSSRNWTYQAQPWSHTKDAGAGH